MNTFFKISLGLAGAYAAYKVWESLGKKNTDTSVAGGNFTPTTPKDPTLQKLYTASTEAPDMNTEYISADGGPMQRFINSKCPPDYVNRGNGCEPLASASKPKGAGKFGHKLLQGSFGS